MVTMSEQMEEQKHNLGKLDSDKVCLQDDTCSSSHINCSYCTFLKYSSFSYQTFSFFISKFKCFFYLKRVLSDDT